MAKNNYFYGLGRRKTSTARVHLKSGSGDFVINEKTAAQYFSASPKLLSRLNVPFTSLDLNPKKFAISVKVSGGGQASQLEAICLGVAKALIEVNPDYKATLKRSGLTGRDPRERERKKAGFRSARKKRQFTKS